MRTARTLRSLLLVLSMLATMSAFGLASPAEEELLMPGAEELLEPKIDLFGNAIDDAVTDYRLDERGDLYESHSPDTAILKLGPAGV